MTESVTSDLSCNRCGLCCRIPVNGKIGKPCYHLKKNNDGSFYCNCYDSRLDRLMGWGTLNRKRVLYRCSHRQNAMFDYPDCPNNTGKPMIRLK